MPDQSTNLPILSAITPERVQETITYLGRGRDAAMSVLAEIKPITTDAEYAAANEKLTKVKAIYDKISARRKTLSDPLREFVDNLMSFERLIDYNAKKTPNEYDRARKMLEDYNNQKLQTAQAAKDQAAKIKELEVYKADLKAAVLRALNDMLTGQQKTVVQGMVDWEVKLTLETFDKKFEALKTMPIQLKRDKYDACFHTNFNMKPLMTAEETKTYIDGLKKDFTYEQFNEQYNVLIAPIKNQYVAKGPDVKLTLQKIASDKEAQAARAKDLAAGAETQLSLIDQQKAETDKQIESKQGLDHMEAEFREQGVTQDIETPNSMKIVRLGDQPVKQFTQIVSHSISHPEFPSYYKKGGEEYIDSMGWWLKFFAAHCDTKIVEGLEVEVKAKTVVKK